MPRKKEVTAQVDATRAKDKRVGGRERGGERRKEEGEARQIGIVFLLHECFYLCVCVCVSVSVRMAQLGIGSEE